MSLIIEVELTDFLTSACSMGVLGLVFRWTWHYSNSTDLTWDLIPIFIVKYA